MARPLERRLSKTTSDEVRAAVKAAVDESAVTIAALLKASRATQTLPKFAARDRKWWWSAIRTQQRIIRDVAAEIALRLHRARVDLPPELLLDIIGADEPVVLIPSGEAHRFADRIARLCKQIVGGIGEKGFARLRDELAADLLRFERASTGLIDPDRIRKIYGGDSKWRARYALAFHASIGAQSGPTAPADLYYKKHATLAKIAVKKLQRSVLASIDLPDPIIVLALEFRKGFRKR